MNTNLKLNPSISLRALESRARKAAAIAAVNSFNSPAHKPTTTNHTRPKSKTKKLPMIEREMRAIFQSLKANASETEAVIMEQSGKGATYRATISLYNQSDLWGNQSDDASAPHISLPKDATRKSIRNSRKANPRMMYVFYPATLSPERLGSIAIYGENVQAIWTAMLNRRSIFGHTIADVTLERGRRLFVDITLAS